MRHDVPGGWIEVRDDPATTPERLRRPVKRAMMRAAGSRDLVRAFDVSVPENERPPIPDDMIGVFDEMNDAAAAALVTAWSFEGPVTVEALADLPGNTYDAIRVIVAPHAMALMPDFTAAGMADPKAPGGA